jgi:hypothetical protein
MREGEGEFCARQLLKAFHSHTGVVDFALTLQRAGESKFGRRMQWCEPQRRAELSRGGRQVALVKTERT